MKVKVGNTVYDGELEPVMVILTKDDRENIANMDPDNDRYASFPGTMPIEKAVEWMAAKPEIFVNDEDRINP